LESPTISPPSDMRTLILALLLTLGLAACTSTRNETDARPTHWLEKVTVPSNIRGALDFESAMVDRRDSLLTVQVVILNRTATSKTYRTRFEWLDEDGRKIDTATDTWQRITHPGTTRQYVVGTAPSPLATDWRLSVLDWKN
jgi:uncharacterized protein YcfL